MFCHTVIAGLNYISTIRIVKKTNSSAKLVYIMEKDEMHNESVACAVSSAFSCPELFLPSVPHIQTIAADH